MSPRLGHRHRFHDNERISSPRAPPPWLLDHPPASFPSSSRIKKGCHSSGGSIPGSPVYHSIAHPHDLYTVNSNSSTPSLMSVCREGDNVSIRREYRDVMGSLDLHNLDAHRDHEPVLSS